MRTESQQPVSHSALTICLGMAEFIPPIGTVRPYRMDAADKSPSQIRDEWNTGTTNPERAKERINRKSELIRAIRDHGDWMTTAKMAELTGYSVELCRQFSKEMADAGSIEFQQRFGRGSKHAREYRAT